MSRRGLVISARPIASICCSPPESRLPMLPSALGEPRKQRADLVERPWLGRAAAVGRRRDQILARGEIGENLPALGHQADAELGDAVGRAARGSPRRRSGSSRPRRRQPHDRAHGRGLAHAVAAHQRHHLAGRDGERNAEQHLAAAVAGLDARRPRAARSAMATASCSPR